MGTMVENIRAICKEKGVAVSKLESDLGYGNGYLNPKKIKSITITRAAEIAEYLGVTINELMGAESKKAPTVNGEGITKEQIKIALFGDDAGDISDEDLDNAVQFARFSARERKQRGDNK